MLSKGVEYIMGDGCTYRCDAINGGHITLTLIRGTSATMEHLLSSDQATASNFFIQDDLQHKTSLWLENSVLKQNKKGDGDKSVKQTRGKGRI
jgi:hypothetical protein